MRRTRRTRRTRRELRTLRQGELECYFHSLKLMRNTSDALGKQRFGHAFRTYDWLSIKHAISTLHPCIDQAHLPENQITYHRALLMEFELSLLAVAQQVCSPESRLDAAPYWNWFVDTEDISTTQVSAAERFLRSSLWKYWGSPYGDVDNRFCIWDPYFETSVRTVESAEALNPGITRLFPSKEPFANGFGYFRSAWNANDCPGIARNPSWVFGKDASFIVPMGRRDCHDKENYTMFTQCTQGKGITFSTVDFGPHNMPHIFMGTYRDERIGSDVYGAVSLVFTGFLSVASTMVAMVLWCASRSSALRGKVLCVIISACVLFSISLSCLVLAPQVHENMIGLQGASLHYSWLYHLFARTSIDFKGKEWRNHSLHCPPPSSCVIGDECPRCDTYGKSLLYSRKTIEFIGSDFWDGAYSINENFFFSIHGLYDMLHLAWAEQLREYPNAKNHFGGVQTERFRGCQGTALFDVISTEMCFTPLDIGWEERNTNTCLTHADLLEYTMRERDRPYSYDRLVEEYSWSVIEPNWQDCPGYEELCENESRGAPKSVIHGQVICVRNNGRLASPSVLEANQTKCELASGRRKPDPPLRMCDCHAEHYRHKHTEFFLGRNTKATDLRTRFFMFGVVGLACFTLLVCVSYFPTCEVGQDRVHYTPLNKL